MTAEPWQQPADDGTDYDGTPDLPPEDSPEAEEGAMVENQRFLESIGWGRDDR